MLRPIPLGNAAAVLSALLYVLCAIMVAIAPGTYLAVAESWLHGVQLTAADAVGISAGGFLLGITTLAATVWVSAAGLAVLYNRLGGR